MGLVANSFRIYLILSLFWLNHEEEEEEEDDSEENNLLLQPHAQSPKISD